MSACREIHFVGVTAEVFSCVRQEVKNRYGIDIAGNEGSGRKSGFAVRWKYEPYSQKAMVQCTESPFVVPCGLINSQIEKAAAGCGARLAGAIDSQN